MLLSDTLHLVGFNIFDRNKIEENKKKVDKHRLLGFNPHKNQSTNNTEEGSSPTKTKETDKKAKSIPSFLDGFPNLSEDDLDIISEYEEEQMRKGHFELLFPTKENVETLGPYFESQRHANMVLW